MSARRLVLDVHGVVLNNPLPTFLREVAVRTGQSPTNLPLRWHDELRRDAWLGRISDRELWSRVTRGHGDPREWGERLESRYAPGPAAAHLARWRRRLPVCLLSNHRTAWLLPRLERLGLRAPFTSILVSDQLGSLKPEAEAFAAATAGLADPSEALFVDDQLPNVEAARALGLGAIHARPGDAQWIGEIDALVRAHAA